MNGLGAVDGFLISGFKAGSILVIDDCFGTNFGCSVDCSGCCIVLMKGDDAALSDIDDYFEGASGVGFV